MPIVSSAQRGSSEITKSAKIPASDASSDTAPERILTIGYDPSDIVKIEGCSNLHTMIRLAPDEKVETVGIGDSDAWQAMPSRGGDLIFVKPMHENSYTNMTVVSNRRRYYFELRNASPRDCAAGRIIQEVRFRYAFKADKSVIH